MIHLKSVRLSPTECRISNNGIERIDSKYKVALTTFRNGHVLVLATVFVYWSRTVMLCLTTGIRSEKCVVVRTSYSVLTQT